MRAAKRKRSGRASIIGDMVFSLLTMPAAFSYLQSWLENREDPYLPLWLLVAYVTMGIAQLFRAFRLRGRSKVDFVSHLIYGVAFLVGAGLLFLSDEFGNTIRAVLTCIFWGVVLSGRILSVVRNHRLRNILLNIVAIFLIAVCILSVFATEEDTLFIAMMVAGYHALFSVMAVAFSRIKVDLLRDIIKTTYATEIISGLLLLIFASSWVLVFMDGGFKKFPDAMWYCFAVVTTIGFGDFAATSLFGRLISVVLGIYGIIVVALITSIIVNFYGEMKKAEPELPKAEDDMDL